METTSDVLDQSIVVIGTTLVFPYLPFHSLMGFVPLPAPLMIGLTVLYVFVAELAKKYFYARDDARVP